mmetsp:Transcript_37216/g.72156  ORF Transcript_37216/g.72156 Transcript_37216/m.72156 type:complete len:266 (-) Transcript_37216:68-865(-)
MTHSKAPTFYASYPSLCDTSRLQREPPLSTTNYSLDVRSSEIIDIIIWYSNFVCSVELGSILLLLRHVDLHFRRCQGRSFSENQVGLPRQFSGNVQEWLLVVVVAFCRYVEVLDVLLPVEKDVLRLHCAIFAVNFIPAQNHGDIVANTVQILVPVRNTFVSDTGGYIEHDNRRLPANVVPITKTTEFLLASSIPAVKANFTVFRVELERADVHAHSGDVLFLELSGKVSRDEGRLSNTAISDQDKLEFRDLSLLHVIFFSVLAPV